jgi:hypothetical protein
MKILENQNLIAKNVQKILITHTLVKHIAASVVQVHIQKEAAQVANVTESTKLVFSVFYFCRFREFQISDGSCRCIAGFFFEKDGIQSKQEDAKTSCQPKVYDSCASGEVYNHALECVPSSSCSSQCPNGVIILTLNF